MTMPPKGSNLPRFRSVQLEFAAHIRSPEEIDCPHDVPPRRMQIHLDLVFNNIESFLASAFPIAKMLLGQETWLALVRQFVHRHASESPYFLQISEEFLTFLSDYDSTELPDFMLELCHYEWVELSLDVAQEVAYPSYDPHGDSMGRQLVSATARALTYAYPVHQIGPDNQPDAVPSEPTYLIVYRGTDLVVRFMLSNVMTHRLLALMREMPASGAISCLTDELNLSGRSIPLSKVRSQASTIIEKFRNSGIVLGSIDSESGQLE
jgi:hypothetical protein